MPPTASSPRRSITTKRDPVNLGSGEEIAIRDLAGLIAEKTGFGGESSGIDATERPAAAAPRRLARAAELRLPRGDADGPGPDEDDRLVRVDATACDDELRMCGIVGIWRRRGAGGAETARRMASRLVHRGPDDAGIWTDAGVGIALGFRRLSIIDLSPAGHQPMMSASGRYALDFQRRDLQLRGHARRARTRRTGASWRGHSDTEVMLAAFEAWGLDAAVKRFIGMFAIRALGRARAPAAPRSRSHGREAALLRLRRTTPCFSARS